MNLEIHITAPTAAQALRESGLKTMQIGQIIMQMGVPQSDVQSLGILVHTLPPFFPLPASYGGMQQLAGMGIGTFPTPAALQPEVQPPASYYVRNSLSVSVRDPSRIGEIVDAAVKAGAVANNISFHASNEDAISREALDAAAKDARAKAETLAAAFGRQLGDAASVVADSQSDGALNVARQAAPLYPGVVGGQPRYTGELEFRARVLVTYKLQ